MSYRPRDRGRAIELTLELLATGRVAGVPADHRPDELERVLGRPTDEGIATFSGNLVRDWGLLEAYYERADDHAPWHGTLLMGQLHRMPKPLRWTLVARELRKLGYRVTRVPQPTLEDHFYRVDASGSRAVVNGEDTGRNWRRGHLAKISASDWLPLGPDIGTHDFNAVHRAVYQAVVRPERFWAGWLAAHQPEPDPEWFLLAHSAVHMVVGEHPERTEPAVALHDWLVGQAESARVWSAPVHALLSAQCAGNAVLFPLPARPGRPPSDVLIDRCLAALPGTREWARALPTDWRQLAPEDVRRSRLTRALLKAANRLRDHATAPHQTAELAAWDEVRHRLC
ncbi:hypothetical protein [Jidongwangia harbinensis]|uniref:hypothetical protein n=1 Tax=Jidongwangia harbinensis TaxID=2878561 RepID=UPI001CD9F5CB|nr:hypothetical protein [Jidongwangia harbinensis]MCA2215994.1 hypothetical protein [Jidongwangia harbinensis]